MWWWILGYVAIGLVTIRVIAELPYWRYEYDDDDERILASIMGAIFWPIAILFGLCCVLYIFVVQPLATPRRIHRQRRQERMAELLRTQAREAEKAARDYRLPYPTLDEDG